MFDSFNPKDKKLTSLDLGPPPPRPAPSTPKAPLPTPAPSAKPSVVQLCVAQTLTLEGAYLHFAGAHRKLENIVKTAARPEILFYPVYPQQGLTHSLTTPDGLKTIVPLFHSKPMADAYLAAHKLSAVPAACRLQKLADQAEKWSASGINSYALNLCCRCLSLTVSPIAELQSEEAFLSTWRLDLANRRQFAESYGRNAAAPGVTPKQARPWLEGIRDHIDPANPYLHWVIAIYAGIMGDAEAKAASIKRLHAFGPPFSEKEQDVPFNPETRASELAEAMLGLGISLGYLNPGKMAQPTAPPNN